jgi:hypothetical protein
LWAPNVRNVNAPTRFNGARVLVQQQYFIWTDNGSDELNVAVDKVYIINVTRIVPLDVGRKSRNVYCRIQFCRPGIQTGLYCLLRWGKIVFGCWLQKKCIILNPTDSFLLNQSVSINLGWIRLFIGNWCLLYSQGVYNYELTNITSSVSLALCVGARARA